MNIEALIAENLAQKKQIESLQERLIASELSLAKLQHQLELLLKQIYGSKSERFIPDPTNQPTLFSHLQQTEPEVKK